MAASPCYWVISCEPDEGPRKVILESNVPDLGIVMDAVQQESGFLWVIR